MSGKIVKLLISKDPKSTMLSLNQIVLEAGKGIFGDRYYNQEGTFSNKGEIEPDRDVTLIEIEKIDALNKEYNLDITAEDLRRNIVVSNCDLNSLVDKEFQIGEVVLKGLRLCEPCKYLSDKLDNEEVLSQMIHKAGLRAQIIKSGSIDLNSQVEVK
jgi:MOSC domain-containing protein YiiM